MADTAIRKHHGTAEGSMLVLDWCKASGQALAAFVSQDHAVWDGVDQAVAKQSGRVPLRQVNARRNGEPRRMRGIATDSPRLISGKRYDIGQRQPFAGRQLGMDVRQRLRIFSGKRMNDAFARLTFAIDRTNRERRDV